MERQNISLERVETQAGIERLAGMAQEIWTEYFTPLLGAAQVEYMLKKYLDVPALTRTIQEGYDYYFILAGGAQAGFCGVRQEGGALFVSKLYLDRNNRGKGYARAVLNLLRSFYEPRGAVSCYLNCNRYNTPSLAAYNRLGFRIVRSFDLEIGEGYTMNDYELRLDF